MAIAGKDETVFLLHSKSSDIILKGYFKKDHGNVNQCNSMYSIKNGWMKI